jgi:hypothetical protein
VTEIGFSVHSDFCEYMCYTPKCVTCNTCRFGRHQTLTDENPCVCYSVCYMVVLVCNNYRTEPDSFGIFSTSNLGGVSA